jgi:D-cysteine desulfhydrase
VVTRFKLEWLIPDARRRSRRSILTFGGLGTNWGLATALYAREHGLETALALVDQPLDAHVRAQLTRLDASGARIYRTRTKARTVAMLPWLLARNTRGGRPPYLLPAGGSSPVGALGYVEAALEIASQVEDGSLPEPAHVVVPVGTGGTAAGLALGFQLAGLRPRVVGVVVNDQLRLDPGLLELSRDQIGAGCGHPTEAATRAPPAPPRRGSRSIRSTPRRRWPACWRCVQRAASMARSCSCHGRAALEMGHGGYGLHPGACR